MKPSIKLIYLSALAASLALAQACGNDNTSAAAPLPGVAPGATPSATASTEPSATPTASPSSAPSGTPTPSSTPSATPSPSPSASPGNVAVSIPAGATGKGPAAYGTNPLVITMGTTVTWTNNDGAPHTVTADDGSFDSHTLNTGASFSHTFTTMGTFTYFCSIHGKTSMSGAVQVN